MFFVFLLSPQISQVWNNALVNVLKSLYSLGLPSSSREMQSVEHEVLWRLRRLTFRQIASLAEFLASRPQKDNKLLAEVVRKLELRWTELEGTRSVVTLIAKVGHVSPALMDRLEDKVGAPGALSLLLSLQIIIFGEKNSLSSVITPCCVPTGSSRSSSGAQEKRFPPPGATQEGSLQVGAA